MRSAVLCVVIAGVALTTGCAHEPGKAEHAFDPKQIAKTDVDRFADAYRRDVFGSVKLLAEKLYRRNPREWRKAGHPNLEAAVDSLFDPRSEWRNADLGDRQGSDAILLALRGDYSGDRVAAFIVGLGGMLHAAFDGKTEFFLLDGLDPQKIYNSARNVEIAAWKLTNARDAAGNLFLLSNELAPLPQVPNLSFEREFGKLIGNLDLFAHVLADRDNRTIARIVQSIASAVFLPVATLR